MSKFANFKVSDVELLQEEYWEKCKLVQPNDILDKATVMFVKSVIMRSGWLRSRLRSNVVKAARVERGKYKCACCGGLFKATEIQVDHMYARAGFRGEGSFEQWLKNTFCKPSGLAAVCVPCHKAKSRREREITF